MGTHYSDIVYKFNEFKGSPKIIDKIVDYSKKEKEVISINSLDFEFLKDDINTNPFYLLSELYIDESKDMEDIVNDDKDSNIYLGLCALAIFKDVPKKDYRKLFEELRLRGIYGGLKPLVALLEELKHLYINILSNTDGEVGYTDSLLSNSNSIIIDSLFRCAYTLLSPLNVMDDDFTIKGQLEHDIITYMKENDSSDFINSVDIDKMDITKSDTIKKYSQFKDEIEMVTDNNNNFK